MVWLIGEIFDCKAYLNGTVPVSAEDHVQLTLVGRVSQESSFLNVRCGSGEKGSA